MTNDLSRRMRELIAGINRANETGDPLHILPANADINASTRALRLGKPDTSLPDMFERLSKEFEEKGSQNHLAALVGLALQDPETIRNGKLIRDAISLALRRGPRALVADLVDHIDSGTDGLDRWGWISGEGRALPAAVTRFALEDPAMAERLRQLDAKMHRRSLERQIAEADRQIAFYTGRDDIEDTYVWAAQFVSWGMLPAPGLAQRIDELMEGNSIHAPWRILRLQMDLILVENGRHPEVEAATCRIEAGLADLEPSVTAAAGEVAYDLIAQGFLDAAFRDRMRAALPGAMARQIPVEEALLKLASVLEEGL